MSSMPFFSIILPVYNVEDYLDRCVKSILDQDFDDYEIIIVDDGSTDSCPALCDSYKDNSKITVLHKENGGLSSARNYGLKVAGGEYIFFLDSDDYIIPGALKRIHDCLDDNRVDIFKFNYVVKPSDKEVISILDEGIFTGEIIQSKILPMALNSTSVFTFNAWSHIYRHEFIKSNNLEFVSEREIGSEDYLFNISAFLRAESLMHIKDALYNYDYREGSLTKRYRKNLPDQYLKLYLLMREQISEVNISDDLRKHISEALDRFYLWNCFYVVMANETIITNDHTEAERDKNIKRLLVQKEYRNVLRKAKLFAEKKARKIYLLALKTNNFYLIKLLITMRK